MNDDLHNLHLEAGLAIGADKTCARKIDYQTAEKAIAAATQMNQKPTTRNTLEAYPCPFCHGWHIGRAMTRAELESYVENC